jgi:hypothetical protein
MKFPNPLPTHVPRFGVPFPRRNCIDQYTPAEAACRAALLEIEKLGADPVLTDMVTQICALQASVADYVEGKTGTP